uniref:Uncharacterized protein n=1 Tax=Pycnococcus provasolii TaxID=41880 RepID=A0A7S2F647_9CHLO|mmetsp:Transcript_1472/g.3265  ORF Transcript_1472/g.3265 Transcript_1472/m.3265 type:complete len:193 (+) Transcript_1472:3-581(+)
MVALSHPLHAVQHAHTTGPTPSLVAQGLSKTANQTSKRDREKGDKKGGGGGGGGPVPLTPTPPMPMPMPMPMPPAPAAAAAGLGGGVGIPDNLKAILADAQAKAQVISAQVKGGSTGGGATKGGGFNPSSSGHSAHPPRSQGVGATPLHPGIPQHTETALSTFCNMLPPLNAVKAPFPDPDRVLHELLSLPF